MKVKVLKEYSKDLSEEDLKQFLELTGYKGKFTLKSSQKDGVFEVNFKNKINGNIKNLIPYFLKGEAYKEHLKKREIIFKCFLAGIDSIVIPKEFVKLNELINVKEIIPYNGLKVGIEKYIKIQKPEEIKYLLINNIKTDNLKKFLTSFLISLLKSYPLFSFEFENKESFTYYFLSFKNNALFYSFEGFAVFLEDLGRAIYVEKVIPNEL